MALISLCNTCFAYYSQQDFVPIKSKKKNIYHSYKTYLKNIPVVKKQGNIEKANSKKKEIMGN